MANQGDDLRKLVMAGIGAAGAAAKKTGELVEEFSKRGEELVAHGKIANEQLKHDIKESIKENVTVVTEKLDIDSMMDAVDSLTPAERARLLEKLKGMEDAHDQGENG